MKPVLRNNGRSHVGSAHQPSSRRGSTRTLRSGSVVASAWLVAVALAGTGCSGAEGADMDVSPSSSPGSADSASFEVNGENDVQGATANAESVGSTPALLEAEPEHTSPRGEDEGVAAPAAAPPAESDDGAAGDVSDEVSDDASNEVPPAAPEPRSTMYTSGRQLLDTCGKPFVTRGVEQVFGNQLPQGNDWNGLLEQIAASGVNAVRILAGTDTLGVDDVDALLDIVGEHGMVAYVTPYGSNNMRWLEGEDVRAMLAQHAKYILIDAFGEPTFDDREKFLADSTATLRTVRSWGYEVPLTVTANQFGRDLPSLFELGEQIIAADPLHNTVLGWQAYWSTNNYYQEHYGYTLAEAVDAVAESGLPIQLGLDRVTDFPSDATADFGTLMAATEQHGVGWLWWDWFNPYGNENNLTNNGSASDLTPTGSTVLDSHAASVKNTAQRVCVR